MNDVRPAPTSRSLCIVVAIVTVPAVTMALTGALALTSWWPDLPDPVASHWGSSGVDGTSSLFGVCVTLAAVIVVGAVVGGLAVVGAATGRVADSRALRWILALANGLSVFVTVLLLGAIEAQRGVTDIHRVSVPALAIVVAAVCGLSAAALSAIAVPSWPSPRRDPVGTVPTAQLGAAERFLWQRRVAISTIPMIVVIASFGTVIIVAAVTGLWWLLILVAVLTMLMAAFWSVRVTVDRNHLAVQNAIGWPRIRVPMTDIVRAEVVRVHALRDFGGYGQRIAIRGPLAGAQGFVLRSGDALLVTRSDGRRDLVVVDDAAVAAGLINATVAQEMT